MIANGKFEYLTSRYFFTETRQSTSSFNSCKNNRVENHIKKTLTRLNKLIESS